MFKRETTKQAGCKSQQLPGGGKRRADNMAVRKDQKPKMLRQKPKLKESRLRKKVERRKVPIL